MGAQEKKKKPTTLFCSPRFTLTAEHKAQVMQYLSRASRDLSLSVGLPAIPQRSLKIMQWEKSKVFLRNAFRVTEFSLIMGKRICA